VATSRVRYGARTEEDRRRAEATRSNAPPVWSEALTAIWETDADVVAAVLPPPLEPAERPLVRATITRVDMAGYVFGAGYFAVAARHEGQAGEYPLVMPMSSERAVIGGREVLGEPKKLGDVVVSRDGDRVSGTMSRLGITFVELQGRLVEELTPPPERLKTDFYFKFLPAPDGKGFDAEPALVYCYKTERARSLHRVEGEVTLRDSEFDPVVDLPVRTLVEMSYGERQTDQRGEIVSRVPAEWLTPFVHQRYDDPLQQFDAPPGR
jgi:acetoacetate decarboxylase